jgi:hypothetical protein
MKTKLKVLALLATIASLSSSAAGSEGWGEKQGSNTVKGLIIGSTLGGVVGHQHGKQKEGIIIGGILGSVFGNQIGKGKDARESQPSQYNYRYQQSRAKLYNTPAAGSYTRIDSTDPEVLAAKQRAEAVEKELEQERERIRSEQARQQALAEMHAREQAALQELQALRGGQR